MKQTNLSADKKYFKIKFGLSWLAVVPASAWAVSTIYLTLFSEHMNQAENWVITLAILLMMGVSLFCHVLAHLYTARMLHGKSPDEMTIFIFGDAAQGWATAASDWQEMSIAIAGPFASLVVSGLLDLLLNAQTNTFSNLV